MRKVLMILVIIVGSGCQACCQTNGQDKEQPITTTKDAQQSSHNGIDSASFNASYSNGSGTSKHTGNVIIQELYEGTTTSSQKTDSLSAASRKTYFQSQRRKSARRN